MEASEICVSEGWNVAAVSSGLLDGEKNSCIPRWVLAAPTARRVVVDSSRNAALDSIGFVAPPPDIEDVVGRIVFGFGGQLTSAAQYVAITGWTDGSRRVSFRC
jgi:hypothetical protein